MANSIEKGRLKQKNGTDTVELHPHTDADVVSYTHDPNDSEELSHASTVQEALDRIINAGVGVTDVVDEDGVTLLGTGANKSIATVTPSTIHAVHEDSVDAANGVAPLDSLRKVPVANLPDFLMGQMIYGGTVNSSGTATLSSNAKAKLGLSSATVALPNTPTDTYEGVYFLGDSTCSDSTVKGVASFSVGDWLIAAGGAWKKIDNTDAVTSVNGDVGPITLGGSDIEHDTQADPDGTTVSANINKLASDLATTAATIKVTKEEVGTSGTQTGNAITGISVSDGQIKVTKAQTFLLNSEANVSTTSGSESVTVKSNTLNVVTRNTAQTIAGTKTFSGGIILNNTKYITVKDNSDSPHGALGLDASNVLQLGSATLPLCINASGAVKAYADDWNDLGSSTKRWKTLYVSNGISDGTNTFTTPSKSGTLLVDTDIDGKANLEGGNEFSGGKQKICVDGLTGPAFEGTGVDVYNNKTSSVPEYHTVIRPYGLMVYQGATAGSNGYAAFEKTQIRTLLNGTTYTYDFPMKSGTLLVDKDITGKADKATLTTKGDIYYASAASTPARLGIGSEGQALTVGSSGVPVWADLPEGFVVKALAENSTLTQQEYDDFVARKLALIFTSGAGVNAGTGAVDHTPSVYVGNDSSGNPKGSACKVTIDYSTGQNSPIVKTSYIVVDKTSRTVSRLNTAYAITNALTNTPESGSGKLFTAGGAYSALAGKADKANLAYPTGVDEMPFSCVTVNKQGIVTGGAQSIMLVDNGDPNDDLDGLADGGWFFEKDPAPAAS